MTNAKVQRDNTVEKAGQEGEVSQPASLDDHARHMAAGYEMVHRSGQTPKLLDRVKAQGALLRTIYHTFSATSEEGTSRSYAAEWLLDNFYMVQQALRQVEEDMPGGYYQQLPKLKNGPLQGFPRIYAVAREMARENNARLDLERVRRFIDTFQQVTPLTMGELWALPTMLRLAVIATLTEALAHVAGSETGESGNQETELGTQETGKALIPDSLIPDSPVSESREPPSDTLVANSILSLRALAMQDWKEFFESVSLVERVLSRDPAEVYSYMDFDTRDRYRKVIEELAQVTRRSEVAIAEAAIRLAAQAPTSPPTPPPPARPPGLAPQPVPWPGGQDRLADGPGGQAGSAASQIPSQSLPDPVPGIPRPARRSRGGRDGAGSGRAGGEGKGERWDGRRLDHIGYYLLDQGRVLLEQQLNYRPAAHVRLRRWLQDHPTLTYLGSIGLITLLMLIALLSYGWLQSPASLRTDPLIYQLLAIALLGLVPALTAGVSLVNWLVTQLLPPRVLPKMDFRDGIRADCKTMVVIPTLLTSLDEVESLLRQLELHFLRNPDPHLHFALLTDFGDAPRQRMPDDSELLARARVGIERLNARYRRQPHHPFYLFHRERRWNADEGAWMGWERKRGKLEEFNCLILGRGETSYTVQVGDLEVLPAIRYVITLDADTVLPKDSAQRLIGTMAHPLNRPEFDPKTDRVVTGYTILQPRTEIQPTSANQSLFARVFAGDTGLDLYTRAVSDVYQDLFGEGIYVGKGIYDVAAFARSLEGRVPENALLSHDLFEGLYARAALVTDVVLYEVFPADYLTYLQRMERWIRGDWQLLPWLLPRRPPSLTPHPPSTGSPVPAPSRPAPSWDRDGTRAGASQGGQAQAGQALSQDWERGPGGEGRTSRSSALSAIDHWKIFDNLRRSLVAPALLLWLIAGWLWLPGAVWVWTLAGVLALGVPFLLSSLSQAVQSLAAKKPAQGGHKARLYGLARTSQRPLLRWLLALIFLPYEALIALRAIASTLYRLFISRRYMLQWTTAAHTARLFSHVTRGVGRVWRQMLEALALSLGLAVLVTFIKPAALPAAAPLLLAWLLSPQVAYWISRPSVQERVVLTPKQQQQLRSLARRTWLYFEHFMGPEDHWLPPDHFQEMPRGLAAHRTSPTNIGLALLSTLAAFDMGYIGLLGLVLRLRDTFHGMDQLEKHRGHILNWYDTRTLKPLPPRYVSTVDSGNLAACLLALRQGCLALARTPVLRWERWQGLLDTLWILGELLETRFRPAAQREHLVSNQLLAVVQSELEEIGQRILDVKEEPGWRAWLLVELMEHDWPELEQRLGELVEEHAPDLDTMALRNLRVWSTQVGDQLSAMKRELDILVPWMLPINRPPALFREASPGSDLMAAWQGLLDALPVVPTLDQLSEVWRRAEARLSHLLDQLKDEVGPSGQVAEAREWCHQLAATLSAAPAAAAGILISIDGLSRRAEAYVQEMDFRFLFDARREVFHVGYNVDAEKPDNSYYDLLASEARVASLLAIARGDVPEQHWITMGRPLTQVDGLRALLSWNGSMFEYLMPMLLTRSYGDTLLGQSIHAVVQRQIEYARQKNVPWGISESGYYGFDNHMNYQYRGFGVPGLGFKRGLGEDLVITPYASLLALSVQPKAVVQNIQRFIEIGMVGTYGLYEAVDYTPAHLPLGKKQAIVRSFMAHHQGMILLSLVNYLYDGIMVERFQADPHVQSVELLLQEQIPHFAPLEEELEAEAASLVVEQPEVRATAWAVPVQTPFPEAHYLSNGRYGVLLTNAGSGYSTWQERDLTRWRADTTLDDWGTWIYIQDIESGAVWSAGSQPIPHPPASPPVGGTEGGPAQREVYFYPHQVDFRCNLHGIVTHLAVTVPPEDDVEIRRLQVTNQTDQPRRLRVTSYGEVVLSTQDSDRRHPAFNKLFIVGEYHQQINGLLFTRRAPSLEEAPIHMVHALVAQPGLGVPRDAEPIPTGPEVTRAYETDRGRFLGRGGTLMAPAALDLEGHWLTGTMGAVLDPIMALGQMIDLAPHATAQLAFVTLAAESRPAALALAAEYQDWAKIERAFDQARSQSELELRQLELDTQELKRIQQLLSLLLYPDEVLRPAPAVLAANVKGQSGLWPYAISGDYPILLVQVHQEEETALVHELLRAHTYWRDRGLKIDLVILNEKESGYSQELQGQLHRLLSRLNSEAWLNRRGGIFLLRTESMLETERGLLLTAARVVLDSAKGTLAEQLQRLYERPAPLPAFVPTLAEPLEEEATPPLARPTDLRFDNGLGGFNAYGREYVIYLEPGEWTPAPWANVIANPDFGFLITEAGGGYSWCLNSGENRLTPWSNDPVRDLPGEALYLRDEETAEIWSPTPLPAAAAAPYLVRHGAGYSIFEHHSHGLIQRVRLFAVHDAPVKIVQLRLENTWSRMRRLTATYYSEWVLGVNRDQMQAYIVPEYDRESRALLARNAYNAEFGERVAFVAASKEPHGLTANRTEFLGRLGNLQSPAALRRIGLSGRVEAGCDPCAAIQLHIDLHPGQSEEVFFLIGQGGNKEEAVSLIRQYQSAERVANAWQTMTAYWDELLGAVSVQTPDLAMDLLLNRWLLYQVLACRVWGRSAIYQSSGAYGFRDQLQDVMALVHTAPELMREHILRAARHQFEVGDVLHWWHPPSGRGVRTRISDDLLWLPFVTAHYVAATGDSTILREEVPFLRGSPLALEEQERYGHYETTKEAYTLYEHCLRAIKQGSTAGPHALPLIGTGDWNDGMSRVGSDGRGESIWLGWFLYATLEAFASVCEQMDDEAQARAYRQQAAELQSALELHGWDGEWYRRAYYDDGTILGSAQHRECQIDSIAQSWAVLSGAGDGWRVMRAMAAVQERLVQQKDRLILLFTPPFDRTPRDPGYIKGYPPGVRENGGQYTHAALWAIWAWARLGQGDYAESLFQLINPIYHSSTPQKVGRYRVEPYVMAADVYGAPPHTGRGGWTWYSGSAAWMYRLGLEAILGLTRVGDMLHIEPCIPKSWPDYQLTYRAGDTHFQIQVENPDGVNSGVKQVELDGEVLPDGQIPLRLDGRRHQVRVLMGKGAIKVRRYNMERELSCSALGVANCDYVARGEAAADVVEDMVEHLEDKHGIDMPDIEDIMQGMDYDKVFGGRDPAANLIVRRMHETLNIQDENVGST